jgi:hypothetical protein
MPHLKVRLASRPAGGTTATVAVPERLLVELPATTPAAGAVPSGAFPAGAHPARSEAPVRLVPRSHPRSDTDGSSELGGSSGSDDRGGSTGAGRLAEAGRPDAPVPAHRLAEAGLSPAAEPAAADALPRRVSTSLRDIHDEPGRPVPAEPPSARHREHVGSWADDVAAFADGTSRAESDRG